MADLAAESCRTSRLSAAFQLKLWSVQTQFLLNSREERAKELLTEPNSSIAAARSVGFHSTLQLDRAFRRLIGMTPSSYRDQVADNESK
jgi:transcriptional regulator GlxA family with amidase domain